MIEYKVIIEALDGSPNLKKLGEENWELCGILPSKNNGTAHTFYFKRNLQPNTSPDGEKSATRSIGARRGWVGRKRVMKNRRP